MKVGDLVKYVHAIRQNKENYFGVVVGIEKPLHFESPVYRVQWMKGSHAALKYLEYLQSDSLEKVS
jgi:hypothetical protein|tara:strand:+ start:201 stop:398 length:198 start_codon:yes stop_codon:yes gene_type:complete